MTIRTTDDIIELHRAMMSARAKAATLRDHADTIGDWTFAYWIGQAHASIATAMEHLLAAREVDKEDLWHA